MRAQTQQDNTLTYYKTQKPLVLDVRFCACKAVDYESDSLEPIPQFFEEATAIEVSVSERGVGFVSSKGMTFGYSIMPGPEAGVFVLENSAAYSGSEESFNSQSVLTINIDGWITTSGYENKSEGGNEYFSVAVKLSHSK